MGRTLSYYCIFLAFFIAISSQRCTATISAPRFLFIARTPSETAYQGPRYTFRRLPTETSKSLKNDLNPADITTVSDFFNKDSRLGFIRKVYSIFGLQTITAIAMIIASTKNLSFQQFLQHSRNEISIISILTSISIMYLMQGNRKMRHQFPLNLILLMIFTIADSFLLSLSSLFVDAHVITMALIYTLISFIGITVFSFQQSNKTDLNSIGSWLFTSLITITVGNLVNGFYFHLPFLENIISIIAALTFAGYILYDTKMIISGRKTMKSSTIFGDSKENDQGDTKEPIYYNSKEYIFAAMSLYLDFTRLLVQLIQILVEVQRRKQDEDRREEQRGKRN